VPSDRFAWLCIASYLSLRLSNLQQLSLRGFITELLDQSVGWDMPSLRIFSIYSGIIQYGAPDVVDFLTAHGLNLVVLDLNSNVDPPVDVPMILDICPVLTIFMFNADW
jgi:hypothetical protein